MDIDNILNIISFAVVFGLILHTKLAQNDDYKKLRYQINCVENYADRQYDALDYRTTKQKPAVTITQTSPRKWAWDYNFGNAWAVSGTATTYAGALTDLLTALEANRLGLSTTAPVAPPAKATNR